MIAMIGRVREKMDAALNKGDLIISVNGFIPKPFTPFQWSPLCDVKTLKRRFKMLETAFKKRTYTGADRILEGNCSAGSFGKR